MPCNIIVEYLAPNLMTKSCVQETSGAKQIPAAAQDQAPEIHDVVGIEGEDTGEEEDEPLLGEGLIDLTVPIVRSTL